MIRLPDKLRLFFLSFLSLFLELALIRYIPANVILVGFFSNLILIASFAGLGLGFLLTKRDRQIFFLSPVILLALILLIKLLHIEVNVASSEVIFFKSISQQGIEVQPYYVLPALFLLSAAVFIPIGIELGRLFRRFQPLTAYSLDILGSIAGITAFSVLAFFWTPAWVWFAVISLLYLVVGGYRTRATMLQLPVYIAVIACIWAFNTTSLWSPYYKINVFKLDPIYAISTNDIGHQYVSTYNVRETFYFVPYTVFDHPVYKNVLIIGAGAGGDTGITLAVNPGVEHIDAVEIDPVIMNLGVQLNQDHAYQDPRVTLYNTDGRQFLARSKKKYDLVLFALTDSLTLANNTSGGIRLESFLFTTDAFRQVKEHLTANGLFAIYNYYRDPWLVDKLAAMMKSVYGSDVYLVRDYALGRPATILAGPRLRGINKAETGTNTSRIGSTSLPLATDNWPFLYLKNKNIPDYYLNFLGAIAALTFLLYLTTRIGQKSSFNLRLFFFGAGFLLLETKSLTTFSLLFGTTWLVNALVFGGILLFVLLANVLCTKFDIKQTTYLYAGLFLFLAADYVVPPEMFLTLTATVRYAAAVVLYFTPIFIANILFSLNFRYAAEPDTAFGSNLLGAVFGGLFEYTSLIWGYQVLILFTTAFYILSLVKLPKRHV